MRHRQARRAVLILSGLNVGAALGISVYEVVKANYLVAVVIWIAAPVAARAIIADWRKLRQSD